MKNKVLIIGLDGCRSDALLLAETPNIDKYWKNGAFNFYAKTDPITVSGPAWTAMLTGVFSGKHGILDNEYDVDLKYPHFFNIAKKYNPELTIASIPQWAPINNILKYNENDIVVSPDSSFDVTTSVVKILHEKDPDVVFVQLDDIDGAGHTDGYGPHVAGYLKSIEQMDEYVGKITSAVKKRKTINDENWLVIITSDHGGFANRHGENSLQEEMVFFISYGNSVIKGDIEEQPAVTDIAVTALAHLGVEIKSEWDLDGKVISLK
ncbi:MAG: sulfatase-like hydrolase/transferase [bacterium]|nr:sulfatase-like hydrolase/transferase [bacterium]